MSIRDTRRLLKRWGRWAAGSVAGYPRCSAFARLTTRPTNGSGAIETDPDILACDRCIAKMDMAMRKVLLKHYCAWGSAGDKAHRLGISRTVYYERLSDAQWYVHISLEGAQLTSTDGLCQESVSVRFLPAAIP